MIVDMHYISTIMFYDCNVFMHPSVQMLNLG